MFPKNAVQICNTNLSWEKCHGTSAKRAKLFIFMKKTEPVLVDLFKVKQQQINKINLGQHRGADIVNQPYLICCGRIHHELDDSDHNAA